MSGPAIVSAKTVELTIDGETVQVPKGATILQAARQNNVYIPTLCYLEKLLPIGSCRVCSVEVESVDGPVMSCTTPVTEGMSVITHSEALSEHRKQMVQYILVNHPLDCPVCERSGECSLQNRTLEFGITDQIFAISDHAEAPTLDWGVIRYDENLCIMCERCVKICHEIQGFTALTIDGNGYFAKINTIDGEKLDCDFCGQCLAVCPVGSLSSGITLSGRSWETTKTESICPHCSVGCSYHINTRNGQIVRITSDDNIGVNNGNLCSRGRFGFEAFQSENRILSPLVKNDSRLEPATWPDAMLKVADKIMEAKASYGPDSVAVIASETLSNEDAYVLQRMMREAVGSGRINTLSNMKNPALNAGLFDEFGVVAPITGYDEIKTSGAFLFFGLDAEKENPVIANMIRTAMRDNHTHLYVANTRNTLFEPFERLNISYNYGSETALIAGLISAVVEGAEKSELPQNSSKLAASAKGADPAKAAKTCGCDEKDIRDLAKGLLKEGGPLIFVGSEIHDHPASLEIMKGLANLAELTGGKVMLYREYCNSQGVNDMGLSPTHLPGYVKAEKALDGDFFDALDKGEIKVVIVAGADPTVFAPDGRSVKDVLSKVDFLVVTASHMTETALMADVILPTTTAVEREGSFTNNEGRVSLIRKVVEPVGEAKPEWEIFSALGRTLGLKTGYGVASEVTAEISKTVPGYEDLTVSKIEWGDRFVAYPGRDSGQKGHAFSFDTTPTNLKVDKGYKYQALIGNSLYHIGTLSIQSDALNKIVSKTYVEISPADATAEDLHDGDLVSVESKQTSITAIVRVTDKSPAGVVFLPKNFEQNPALWLVSNKDPVTWVKITKA